jgi:very-short-patch-repair endonuclease
MSVRRLDPVSLTSPSKGEVGAQRRVGVDRFDRTLAKTARARALRRAMTPAEAKLWSHLRNSNMRGVAFRRQHPIGDFVLDFYCSPARLAVEVDGGQHGHAEYAARDQRRDAWFEARGIATLRFWNDDVLRAIDGVLETIWRAVDRRIDRPTPTPTLPLAGGGGSSELSS